MWWTWLCVDRCSVDWARVDIMSCCWNIPYPHPRTSPLHLIEAELMTATPYHDTHAWETLDLALGIGLGICCHHCYNYPNSIWVHAVRWNLLLPPVSRFIWRAHAIHPKVIFFHYHKIIGWYLGRWYSSVSLCYTLDYTYSWNDPIKSGRHTPTRPLARVMIRLTRRKLLVSFENSVEKKIPQWKKVKGLGLEITEDMGKEQE